MGNQCLSSIKGCKPKPNYPVNTLLVEDLLVSLAGSDRKRSPSHLVIRAFQDSDLLVLRGKGLLPIGRKYVLDVSKSNYVLRDEGKGWIAICDDVSAYAVLTEGDDEEQLREAVLGDDEELDIEWIQLE